MATTEQLYGRLSILLGSSAALITAGFACFVPGMRVEALFRDIDPLAGSAWTLPAFILSALLFQYGTPFLCAASVLAGLRARRRWTGRAGMSLAAISLIAYGLYIRSYLQLLSQ